MNIEEKQAKLEEIKQTKTKGCGLSKTEYWLIIELENAWAKNKVLDINQQIGD